MLKGQINPEIRDEHGKIIPWRKRNDDNRLRNNTSARYRRALNPGKGREENRKYREKNPFGTAVIVANARANKLEVISTLTKEEWKSIVVEKNFTCHICDERVSLEIGSPDRLSLDHIVPMSRGGGNTKDNVAPSHRRCNQSRSDMTLEEFDSWIDKVHQSRRDHHGRSKKS